MKANTEYKTAHGKPSIRQTKWDNWYGYIGGKKVIAFDSHLGSQEEHAKTWLRNKLAAWRHTMANQLADNLTTKTK